MYLAITCVIVSSCSHYYIVISLELLEDPEAIKESELSANPTNDLPFYVTASVNYENFQSHFTIGDGSNSTDPILQRKFYNAPLLKQQEYYYFIRAYSEAHTIQVNHSVFIMILILVLNNNSIKTCTQVPVLYGGYLLTQYITLLQFVLMYMYRLSS